MRLIKDEDINKAKDKMDCYITTSRTDYETHPSYGKFVDLLKDGCDEAAAKRLWNRLLEGLKEVCQRNTNTTLAAFAEEAASLELLSTRGEELALWTGGLEMSQIAQFLGYCTLEKTIIGKAFVTIPITSLWNCECQMWNELSRKFVEGYSSGRVHIYFRNMDQNSVLETQEIAQLKRQKCEILRWHPIYYNGSAAGGLLDKYSEVGLTGDAINISDKNQGFGDQKTAGEKLQEKMRAFSYEYNKMSFENANSPFFNPRRAPFAFYE